MITTLSKESIDIKAENLFLEEVIEIYRVIKRK